MSTFRHKWLYIKSKRSTLFFCAVNLRDFWSMRTLIKILFFAFLFPLQAQERLLQPFNLMQMEHHSLSEFVSPHQYNSIISDSQRFSLLFSHVRPLQITSLQYNTFSILSTQKAGIRFSKGLTIKNAGFGPYQEWLLTFFAARNFGESMRTSLSFSHGSVQTTAYQPFRVWQVSPELNFRKNQWQCLVGFNQWVEMQPNFLRFRSNLRLIAEKNINNQLWITAGFQNGKVLQSSLTFKKSSQVAIRITANSQAHFGVAVSGKTNKHFFYQLNFFSGYQGMHLQNHFMYAH